MPTRHQIRELALQALYQYDARGEIDAEQIELSVMDAPHAEPTKRQALALARGAWAVREKADALAAELADWPTHRQPVVDRCILRLGYYEIASGMTPAPVAINEAVELAKTFGSQHSPAFINGVMDPMARRLQETPAADVPPPPKLQSEDAWLADAMKDAPPLS